MAGHKHRFAVSFLSFVLRSIYGRVGVPVVYHVMQHDAAIGMHGGIHLRHGAERGHPAVRSESREPMCLVAVVRRGARRRTKVPRSSGRARRRRWWRGRAGCRLDELGQLLVQAED